MGNRNDTRQERDDVGNGIRGTMERYTTIHR